MKEHNLPVMPEVKIEIDVADESLGPWMSPQYVQELQKSREDNMSITETGNTSDSQAVPSDQTTVLVKQEPTEDHVTNPLFLQQKTDWKQNRETGSLEPVCPQSSELNTDVNNERRWVKEETIEYPWIDCQSPDGKTAMKQEEELTIGFVSENMHDGTLCGVSASQEEKHTVHASDTVSSGDVQKESVYPPFTQTSMSVQKHAGQELYSGKECSFTFTAPGALTGHMQKHTGEPSFSCTVCSAIFTQPSQLTVHMHKHTGKYVCRTCGATFKWFSSLSVHRRKHTGERPYSCNVCTAIFRRSGDLTVHMRTHTGERPYSCKVCSAAFLRSSYLKNHMRTHTGERPYSCNVCSATFLRSSYLKNHMRTHTGERPYSCNVCSATFTRSSYLKDHMRKHS